MLILKYRLVFKLALTTLNCFVVWLSKLTYTNFVRKLLLSLIAQRRAMTFSMRSKNCLCLGGKLVGIKKWVFNFIAYDTQATSFVGRSRRFYRWFFVWLQVCRLHLCRQSGEGKFQNFIELSVFKCWLLPRIMSWVALKSYNLASASLLTIARSYSTRSWID